ncbi:MAG: hypothetical protein JSW65_04460 [Candidatus Bipolaricaulota bacterium]|nr:MAG: hypothetical protein JSW65_04460 [Candidatus Bipolaricaulota bacterium]
MDLYSGELNLVFAWVWVCVGILYGAALGSRFHEEGWMDGYGSFRRRLYRLAHVAIFALAMLNLLFHFTARSLEGASVAVPIASLAFVIGAVFMPVCCLLVAHRPKLRMAFAVPITSLLLASVLTAWQVIAR